MALSNPKVLILCVDRDDDIGVKAKAKTPIVGRDACIKSAIDLSLVDPEEADANAIFASVKLLDELKAKGVPCEVAIVSGDQKGGYSADQKIKAQVLKLKERLGFQEIILVSDGIEDEVIIPVLQSVAPIASVHRIIIKHSRSVEESYAILAKYFKMLIYDPRYSKFFLGIPGILLLIYGAVYFTPFYHYVNYFLALILGLMFVIRGFGIDKAFQVAKRRTVFFYVRMFAFVASILIVIVASMQAYSYITTLPEYDLLITRPDLTATLITYLAGAFIENAQPMIWIAIGINLVVGAVYHAIRRSAKFLRDIIALSTLTLFYLPTYELAQILKNPHRPVITIVSLLLLSLAALIVIGYTAYFVYMKRRKKVEAT